MQDAGNHEVSRIPYRPRRLLAASVTAMRRLQNYLHIAAAQLGLAYVALWAIAFFVFDYGTRIFGDDCRPDSATLLFYWVCEPRSPLSFAAGIANTALSATIWAPVYVAAATVRPDTLAVAVPILLVHLIGLPLALLVSIRLMLQIFQAPHRLMKRHNESGIETDDAPPKLKMLAPRSPLPSVKPRDTFGLRGLKP